MNASSHINHLVETMASPIVFASYPPARLFKLPPYSDPQPIPPPHSNYLFTIPDNLFVAALDPKVPITIAAVYAVTAKALNVYNKSTGKKPWAISQTKAFHAFVILHNIFLAVYSAWTWYGMLGALQSSIVSPNGPDGWAATIDSFCKVNGPAGIRNAQTYNQASGTWSSLSGIQGSPSREQSGRLWNNGLAFYGWLFYISKFYEVVDTLIILAKGKLSSTLQTYHHAGAMMAMWAGMRYMSVPIWIFVFFNSAIHSLMVSFRIHRSRRPVSSNMFLVYVLHNNRVQHSRTHCDQARSHIAPNFAVYYRCLRGNGSLLHLLPRSCTGCRFRNKVSENQLH